MAGNSIYFDRKFLNIWMPKLEKLFHHRMLDVSAFQSWLERVDEKLVPEKYQAHRAVPDCQESIRQLKQYTTMLGLW
jgi:oligoribonuclease